MKQEQHGGIETAGANPATMDERRRQENTASVIIIDPAKRAFYLVKRSERPRRGLMWFEGSIGFRERWEHAAQRIFEGATMLNLPEHRFRFYRADRYFYPDVPPPEKTEHGVDRFAFIHTVQLTGEELAFAQRNLKEPEYLRIPGIVLSDRTDLLLHVPHGAFNKILVKTYDKVFPSTET